MTANTSETPSIMDQHADVTDDADRIDPVPEFVELIDGTRVRVVPLRTRQFFSLLRIITRGGAHILPSLNLSFEMDDEEFIGQFLALVLFAVGEAEDEAIEFVRRMVEPDKTPDDPKLAAHARALLDEAFVNPSIEDVITILETIIRREGQDIKALGNRLRAAFSVAQKTGQLKMDPSSKKESSADKTLVSLSSEASHAPSI